MHEGPEPVGGPGDRAGRGKLEGIFTKFYKEAPKFGQNSFLLIAIFDKRETFSLTSIS